MAHLTIRIGRIAKACGVTEADVKAALTAGAFVVFDGGTAVGIPMGTAPALSSSVARTLLGSDEVEWCGRNELDQHVYRLR